MTTENISQWLNKGLVSEDEANRLLCEVIENQEFKWGEQRESDDDWYYAKEEKEETCADADVDDVDFSDIEI